MISPYDVSQFKPRYSQPPKDIILDKMEITPMPGDGMEEYELSPYETYARHEIVDFRPDKPFLESDFKQDQKNHSIGILNMREGGTRGSAPLYPRHPDMFYGFMDQDPRGRSDDPRMNEFVGQMRARTREITGRMTDSTDMQVPQTPWTERNTDHMLKETHKWTKARRKVFSMEKEGRWWGNKTIVPEHGVSNAAITGKSMQNQSILDDISPYTSCTSSAIRSFKSAPACLDSADTLFRDTNTCGIRHEGNPGSRYAPTKWKDTENAQKLPDQYIASAKGSKSRRNPDELKRTNPAGDMYDDIDSREGFRDVFLHNANGTVSVDAAARGGRYIRGELNENPEQEMGYSRTNNRAYNNYVNGSRDNLYKAGNDSARAGDIEYKDDRITRARHVGTMFSDVAEVNKYVAQGQSLSNREDANMPKRYIAQGERTGKNAVNVMNVLQQMQTPEEALMNNTRSISYKSDPHAASMQTRAGPAYFREDESEFRRSGIITNAADGRPPVRQIGITDIEMGIERDNEHIGRADKHSMYANVNHVRFAEYPVGEYGEAHRDNADGILSSTIKKMEMGQQLWDGGSMAMF